MVRNSSMRGLFVVVLPFVILGAAAIMWHQKNQVNVMPSFEGYSYTGSYPSYVDNERERSFFLGLVIGKLGAKDFGEVDRQWIQAIVTHFSLSGHELVLPLDQLQQKGIITFDMSKVPEAPFPPKE